MIIPIYKPSGMTSHDVAAKLKRAFAVKPKIGHTGTLDPMCTGVLVILTDSDTKLSDLLPSDKAYRAIMKLGIATDTQDVTGETVDKSTKKASYDEIKAAAESFIGTYDQTPPMYSAVKKNGVPLYKMAREGKTVDIEAKKVTIYGIENTEMLGEDEFAFDVSCSSGTYIRTLCVDIGEKLGIPCCMKALERTVANGFSVNETVPLDKAVEKAADGTIAELSIPYSRIFRTLPKVQIPDNGLNYYLNGGRIASSRCTADTVEGEKFTAFDSQDNFLGLAGIENGEFYGIWKKQ